MKWWSFFHPQFKVQVTFHMIGFYFVCIAFIWNWQMNKNYSFLVGFLEHYASTTEVLVSSPDSAWIVSSFLYRTTKVVCTAEVNFDDFTSLLNGSNIWNFINPLQCILRLTVTRLFCLILHEGMALTDHEMVDIHYSKMASLQVTWRH